MESNSFAFVKRNLEIFGFGNDEEAIQSTFIELLDNSIDALLQNTTLDVNEKMIEIKLSQQSDHSFCFDIIDNGIGMKGDDIPLLCGGFFHSTKQQTQCQSIGKFGIGLKAILLYYNSTLTVSSSLLSEESITSYKVNQSLPLSIASMGCFF